MNDAATLFSNCDNGCGGEDPTPAVTGMKDRGAGAVDARTCYMFYPKNGGIYNMLQR